MFVRFQTLEVRTTGEFGLALCTTGLRGVHNWAVCRNINITTDSIFIDFIFPVHTNGDLFIHTSRLYLRAFFGFRLDTKRKV